MTKEKKELSKNLWSGDEDYCKLVLAALPDMSSSIPCFTDPTAELCMDLPNTMLWKVSSPQQVWNPLTSPCFDHKQKFPCPAVSVVGLRYPVLDRFHTDSSFKGISPPAVFLDQRGVGGIFSSSKNSLVLFSGVPESPRREGRIYWQCISLCLCLPWVLSLLYSSLHVLTPFFYSCFWKAIRTCAILSSLFSQAACVVLTSLSCKAFLLFLFGIFFLSFSILPCFFFFSSALIFKCHTERKLLALGKHKQTLHV